VDIGIDAGLDVGTGSAAVGVGEVGIEVGVIEIDVKSREGV